MKEMYNSYKKELSKKNIIFVVIFIVFLAGLIFGSLYITILKDDSKKVVLDSVSNYFETSNKVTFSSKIKVFKTSLLNNLIYFILMWFFGVSGIGAIFILIMTFFKSFTLGFSIAGIFAKYKSKAVILVLCYLFPSTFLTALLTIFLACYSLNLSLKLIKHAFLKKQFNFSLFMGKYFFLLMILILASVLSAFFDGFVTPYLLKLFTNIIK